MVGGFHFLLARSLILVHDFKRKLFVHIFVSSMQRRRLTEGKLTLNTSPPSIRLTMFYLELEWMVREGAG